MDIDRTPELLTWIFSGMFGKTEAKKEQQQQQQPVRVGLRQCAFATDAVSVVVVILGSPGG